jgi:hypothetical protein
VMHWCGSVPLHYTCAACTTTSRARLSACLPSPRACHTAMARRQAVSGRGARGGQARESCLFSWLDRGRADGQARGISSALVAEHLSAAEGLKLNSESPPPFCRWLRQDSKIHSRVSNATQAAKGILLKWSASWPPVLLAFAPWSWSRSWACLSCVSVASTS